MNLQESLDKLFSLHTFGIKLGLENIKEFLSFIGNPHEKIKTFHIAGSNGKGSTAAFIASILKEYRHQKVGLYTSPHFVRFNERIKINNEEIPNEYIANFVNDYNNYIDEHKLTFFEVTTAMAFKYFADNLVDYAVIETGLGGRLDATNVLLPLAVVITSISLEHTNILGDTIEKIAAEKAGIIKEKTNVFTGKLPEEAYKIIEEKCLLTESQLYKLTDYVNEKENSLELYTEEIELDDWTMPLRGDYQKYNAALAGLTVSKTLITDDLSAVSKGIERIIENTGLQGRFEFYNNNPDIIFDSAHNHNGVVNFLTEFKKGMDGYKKRVLLFGALKDKDVKAMLSELKDFFDEIQIVSISNERACSVDELVKLAGEINLNAIPQYDAVNFIKQFSTTKRENNCLVVLGSMYLLGDLKTSLL